MYDHQSDVNETLDPKSVHKIRCKMYRCPPFVCSHPNTMRHGCICKMHTDLVILKLFHKTRIASLSSNVHCTSGYRKKTVFFFNKTQTIASVSVYAKTLYIYRIDTSVFLRRKLSGLTRKLTFRSFRLFWILSGFSSKYKENVLCWGFSKAWKKQETFLLFRMCVFIVRLKQLVSGFFSKLEKKPETFRLQPETPNA